MSQSLAMNLIHLIYSTKDRKPFLFAGVRPSLFEYQAGIFRDLDCPVLTIGGTEDHVHALFCLSKNRALCNVIEDVKKGSSRWIKTQHASLARFQWQSGYGAFSIGQSQVATVRTYIGNQEEHHRKRTFQEEFRAFLKRYKVEYDERYV
ncbi:MAG: hypothetical protein AMXMBFR84_03960 [Candidatus Hydrogenedentota bacterium]